jgi:glycine betaine/proline transport system substrate-binding protein
MEQVEVEVEKQVEVPVTQIVEKEVQVDREVEVTRVVTEEVTKNVEVTRVVEVMAPEGPKDTIVFSDLNWDSAQIQNRIAMYIVKNGYGYPVDVVFAGTVPLQTGLLNGDTHITMEIWLPNQQAWWDNVTKTGQVIPVGKSLDDNWQSAFVVPTYVVKQNPELKSVSDIPNHVDLFTTPESGGKARLVNCISSWSCSKLNEGQVEAYGLSDYIDLVDPGSATALFADLEGAYEKGENWLGYLWGPTKAAAELDLTLLEEPACVGDAGPETGCAYPVASVLVAVHPSLIGRAPEVVEFLRLWDFQAGSQVALDAWIADNEAEFEDAAVYFLNTDDIWTNWVTDEAEAGVMAALENE